VSIDDSDNNNGSAKLIFNQMQLKFLKSLWWLMFQRKMNKDVSLINHSNHISILDVCLYFAHYVLTSTQHSTAHQIKSKRY